MTKRPPFNFQIKESFPSKDFPILISSCLLGIHCRYDGRESGCPSLIDFASSAHIIPICPEQMGGLPTPRPPARIVGGDGGDVIAGKAKVINSLGEEVTAAFRKGAEESLRVARLAGAAMAIFKDKSPSCGVITVQCEGLEGPGMGVTAALFQKSGIRMMEVGGGEAFSTLEFMTLLKDILEGTSGRNI